MLEMIDRMVTLALTLMVYGIPACLVLAFIHFVVTHPTPPQDELTVSSDNSNLETEQPDESPQEPLRPLVWDRLDAVERVRQRDEITCASVDWQVWRVRDLRGVALRKAFNIQARIEGQMCRKRELIEQYEQAMQSDDARLKIRPLMPATV